MSPRTTGIVFLLAAALAAFVYFYEIRGEEGRKQAEERAKQLFPDVDPEDVSSIELITNDDRKARAERREGTWRLVEPLEFPADAFAVDGMASALAQLTSEAVYESPQPPEVYGLGEGAEEIRFEADGGSHVLRLGDDAPLGGNAYVSVGGAEPVYTVASYRVSALRKSLDDLREKRILRLDRDTVRRIEARWPDGRVALERGEDGWRLVAPLETRADPETVDDLLSDLSFLRADGFVDDPPPDAEAGLAPPALTLELSGEPPDEGAEPPTWSIAIGRDLDGKSRLVRTAQASLFRIPADRLADFPRDLVAYRFKQLAKFSPSDARRVELSFRPPEGEAVVVTATRGETGWTSSPEPIPPERITRMVSELSRLRATGILADAMGPDELAQLRLAPANAVIAVFGDEAEDAEAAKLAEVHLGALNGDVGIAARAAGDETVYEIDYELAGHLPVSLDALRNRFVAQEDETEPEPPADAEDAGAEVAEPADSP